MIITAYENHRPNYTRIAAVTFGILLLCAAAAWWLAWTRSAPARAGEAIVERLHNGQLAERWPKEVTVHRYLAFSEKGNVIGWLARVQFYDDARKRYIAASYNSLGQSEQFVSLSGDVRDVFYEARIGSSPYRITTQSLFRNGQLTIEQEFPVTMRTSDQGPYHAEITAPPDYLPEGTMFSIFRWVANEGNPVRLKIVSDEQAIDKAGTIQFMPVVITPVDSHTVNMTFYSPEDRKAGSIAYHLNANGIVTNIRYPDGSAFKYTDAEEMRKYIPNADQDISKLVATAKAFSAHLGQTGSVEIKSDDNREN